MLPAIRRQSITRLWFYAAFAALVAVVWGTQFYLGGVPNLPSGTIISSSSPDSSPSQWQQMGFQAISETNRLLTTLGTALLGALGLLLGNRDRTRPKPQHLWSAFLCAMVTCLSLFYGYVGHLNLLAMIYSESFDPYQRSYLVPSHLQFYTLLAGVFFLADFTFNNLTEET
jgi:hypothetical protein